MSEVMDAVKNMFHAYEHTSDYKDSCMMEIMTRRAEFEKNLDDMWAIYGKGNMQQIVEYNNGLQHIKDVGLKVLRNSAGKHKIVFK